MRGITGWIVSIAAVVVWVLDYFTGWPGNASVSNFLFVAAVYWVIFVGSRAWIEAHEDFI